MKTLFAVLVAAVLAGGCASTPQRSQGERILAKYEGYIGAPIRGFTAFRQQSWQPVSRTQLILWTSINDAYLLTVTNGCPDMMFTDAISVTSTASEISTFEFVHVRGDRCPITQIQPIDIRQMRADQKELKDHPEPAQADKGDASL